MERLPEFFRPILWSYEFSRVDPERYRDRIVIQAVNYGSLKHWKWIVNHYGMDAVREVLQRVPVTEIREGVRKLVCILFDVTQFNYVPRGAAK